MEREMHPYNVRDRVLKRAFVGLIRNVTGTTGYFKEVADSDQERPAAQVRRQCAEHNKTFTRREKDGRVWYSHHEGNGYCNAAKELVKEWEAPDASENTSGGGGEASILPKKDAPRRPPTTPKAEAPETGSQDQREYTAVLAKASEYGLDEETVLRQVINQKTWADFEKLGGNSEIAEKRLDSWLEKEKPSS